MNRVFLIGRLTKDPETRTSGETTIARYTLAVDRMNEGADFISCVAFGKRAEFVEKYLAKGTKVAVEGAIRTGSYEKDGKKIYTTDVVVDRHEFCEKKGAKEKEPDADGFMDGSDVELPFI